MKDQEFQRRLKLKIQLKKLLKSEGYSTLKPKASKVPKEKKTEETNIESNVKEQVKESKTKEKRWKIKRNRNGQLNMNNQLEYYLKKLQ